MYYVLERQEGVGCPVFINALLHEEFHEGGANINMDYDWHFMPYPQKLRPLPKELFLISKDRKYNFDFASDFNGFIVSAEFLNIVESFDLGHWERSKLHVSDQKGKNISDKEYHFLRLPREHRQKGIVDQQNSKLDVRKNGEIKKIWSLALNNMPLPDMFLSDEVSLTNVALFSEAFFQRAKGLTLRGCRFVDVVNIGTIKPA